MISSKSNNHINAKYADVSYDFTKYLFNLNDNNKYDGFKIDDKLLNICVVLEMFSYALKYKCDDLHISNEKKFNYMKRIKNIIIHKNGEKKNKMINNLIRKIINDTLSYVGFNLIIDNIPITRIEYCSEDEKYIDNETIYHTLNDLNIGNINTVCRLYYDIYAISFNENTDAIKCFNLINNMQIEGNIINALYIPAYQNSLIKDLYIYSDYFTDNYMDIYNKYYSNQNITYSTNEINKIIRTRNDLSEFIAKLISIYQYILILIYYDKIKMFVVDNCNTIVYYMTQKFTTQQIYQIEFMMVFIACLTFTPILS